MKAPSDLVDAQDEMLRQSAAREARLREALSLLLHRDTIACSCDDDEMRCQWHYATRQAVAALAEEEEES